MTHVLGVKEIIPSISLKITCTEEDEQSVEELDPSRPMVGRSVSLLSRGSQVIFDL